MFQTLILMTPLAMTDDAATGANQRTVLVVDDEVLIRWSLSERLKLSGYDVVEAATGAEAMAAVSAGVIDAILLDIKLPDADGLSLLGRFKTDLPEVPVVMITAHGTDEMAAVAKRRGAWGFVHKPFDVEEIATLVDKALAPG